MSTPYTCTPTHINGGCGGGGGLPATTLDEALSFIASERAWYAVQRACGVGRRIEHKGRSRRRGGGRGPMTTTTEGGEGDENRRGLHVLLPA
jgi:hypothetical protein